MALSKVWRDEKGIYVRENNHPIRPIIPREYRGTSEARNGHKFVDAETTQIKTGSHVQKYHRSGTTQFFIRSEDGQVKEVWFIE